jgi:hypothetical protein
LLKTDDEFYEYKIGALPAASLRFLRPSVRIPNDIRAALNSQNLPRSIGKICYLYNVNSVVELFCYLRLEGSWNNYSSQKSRILRV